MSERGSWRRLYDSSGLNLNILNNCILRANCIRHPNRKGRMNAIARQVAGLLSKLKALYTARWCNGNTSDFDSDVMGSSPVLAASMPEWWNWQTHSPQKALLQKACGFESRFGYQYGWLCRPIVSRVRTKQSGKNHKTAWFEVEMLLCHYRQRYRSMHSEFLPIGRAYWTSGGRNGQPSPLMEM